MPEVHIPLTEGQKASADDSPDSARRAINWLTDNDGRLRPRPAIVDTQLDPGTYQAASGPGVIGTYVWTSATDSREYLVYVLSDRTIWSKDLITNVVTALSDTTTATKLDGSANRVVFAEDTQRLVMAGGGQLQVWTGAGLTSRIASTVLGVNQPPLSATHVLNLANYLVANQAALPGTRNQIFWSNLGDGNHLTWNPLNFNTADADPDPIVGLYQNLRQVFAFGTKTVQTFGIGSDPYLPFAASTSSVLGCGAPYSPIAIDGGGFALLDSTRRFVTTDGVFTRWVSKDIDKLLRDLPTVADCWGARIQIAFWDLLLWVLPTAGRAYAYDLAKETWWQWRGWNGADDYAAIRMNTYSYWANGGLHIVGDPTYTNLWTLDPTGTSDTGPGLPVISEYVTQRLDQGTFTRKKTNRVRLFLARGNDPLPPVATLDLARRDDDGPWVGQQMNLGLQGDYASYKDWFPGGIYRRRQYRMRFSGGVTLSVTKMIEDLEPLRA